MARAPCFSSLSERVIGEIGCANQVLGAQNELMQSIHLKARLFLWELSLGVDSCPHIAADAFSSRSELAPSYLSSSVSKLLRNILF